MREQVMVKLGSSKIIVWMMLNEKENIQEEVEPYDEQLQQISRLLQSSQGYLCDTIGGQIMLDSHENSYMNEQNLITSQHEYVERLGVDHSGEFNGLNHSNYAKYAKPQLLTQEESQRSLEQHRTSWKLGSYTSYIIIVRYLEQLTQSPGEIM